jgi:hypothetical protein
MMSNLYYLADLSRIFRVTQYSAHINHKDDENDSGSVKMVDTFLIDPSELQRLHVGEAYFITKVGGFWFDKIKVNYLRN